MRKVCSVVRLSVVLLVAAAGGLAATDTARLVRDINTSTADSYPRLLAEHDGKVFFYLSGERHGLWVSDGTPQGSERLASFIGTTPWSDPSPVVSAGRYAFFTKRDSVLWKTDGTKEGTEPVYRFEVFFCGYKCVAGPRVLGAAGGRVYVSAFEASGGFELWVSDGTTAGTRRVRDIVPGRDGSFPYGFAATSRHAYFIADDKMHGHELWVTDGSATGTHMVADLDLDGSSEPRELTALGETLFFTADDGGGRELWATEGTAATTRLVRRIGSESGAANPQQLTVMNGKLYFIAWGGGRSRLWTSDGTRAGTAVVGAAGADGSTPMVAAGDRVFFAASHRGTGYELWTSDGTAAGTRLVRDIWPGRDSSTIGGILHPPALTALGGEVVFAARDGVHGFELWKSDGTAAGTVLVEDLWPGPDSSHPLWLTAAGGRVFFAADNGATGSELWSFAGDGRPELLADLDGSNQSSDPQALQAAGGQLFFRARDELAGSEIWVTDGSPAGTRRLEICPGSCSSAPGHPQPMADVAGTLFFAAYENEHGAELWKSDGTVAGTVLVKDISVFSSHPGGFSNQTLGFTALGDRLIFGASTPAAGAELWSSDGSEAGTRLVADIRAGERGSDPQSFAAASDRLYFTADDGLVGRELWVSDGTPDGTARVADIRPGIEESFPHRFTLRGDQLFFVAADGFDRELWTSDGTPAGTFKITDVDPERGDWGIAEVATAGGAVFFVAGSHGRGYRLWVTDGTPGGEQSLRAFERYDRTEHLTPVGPLLFFVAADAAGRELWVSDGSPEGTHRVRDLNPGPGSSYPENLTAVGGLLYFKAFTRNASGLGLWQSDGTAAGTRPVLDLGPSSDLTYLQDLTAVGRELFFTARHPRYGRELFALDLAAASGNGAAVAVRDLDGLGEAELAVVAPGATRAHVVDSATGVAISSLPTGESAWQVVDLGLRTVPGGGTAEVAILARRGDASRVRLHDALTAEILAGWRLERGGHALDLATIPDADALAVLRLADAGRAEVLVLEVATGAERARLDVSELGDPIDLEGLTVAGEPAVAVLAVGTYSRRAAVRVLGARSGAVLGDWLVDRPFEPEDLEVVGAARPGDPPRLAILGRNPSRRGVRVLVAELGGERPETIRFGRRHEAFDLETGGGLVSVLLDGRGDRSTRVATRDARRGRRVSSIRFPATVEPLDLALLPPSPAAPRGRLAVLGRADCAAGGFAVTVRDLAAGEPTRCIALSALPPD